MAEPAHLDVSRKLTVDDVVRASRFEVRLDVKPQDRARIDAVRRQVVERLRSDDSRLYGFNTGFGDNRNRPTVPSDQRGTVQDNLILSHSSGHGTPLGEDIVRAAMAVRARTLSLGPSAVRSSVVSALCSLYNSGLVPVVPTFGSVGASGDLAPLSHLALVLMGRGAVWVEGKVRAVDQGLLDRHGVEPLSYRPSEEFPGVEGPESTFGPKEGLALNNGTSFMSAWSALTVAAFDDLLWHADLALALSVEAMCGVVDAFDPGLQSLRPHQGVVASADRVRGFLSGSKSTVSAGRASDAVIGARTVAGGVFDGVQDDYCLRCGPVVHGTAWDALEAARRVVETEINSVTDNPVVVDGRVLSGAHFHGMPLSFAADQLRTAMALVAGISERRVTKLLNDRRNYGLPRHLVVDDPSGVKSGWMIAQYTAASMVSELKTRSMPYCVGNVTTGNEAEDFVSMGANACRAAYEGVAVARGVIAIELAVAVRALLVRHGRAATTDLSGTGVSPVAERVASEFRGLGIPIGHADDRPVEPIIGQVASMLGDRVLRSKIG
ncbi:MAG: aromatic amino acid lyase [Armatimonadetes bacterium]|nr:aromatic amino acid lyase [Armatimonadota bacterium]